MSSYYIYMMTNQQNKVLYTGVTNNLIGRVWQHKEKLFKGFTSKYNLTKLVYYEIFGEVYDAITREKHIKGKKRKFKIDLIEKENKDWKDLWSDIIK